MYEATYYSCTSGFLLACFWIFPLLNILAPFAIWVLAKNKSESDRIYGARLINFQITWSLITYVAMFSGVFAKTTHWSFLGSRALFWIGISLYIANTCFILINTYLLSRGIRKTWFWAIPFIGSAGLDRKGMYNENERMKPRAIRTPQDSF